MPPLPVVPNVVKLVVGGTYHDAKWLNIYHVLWSGTAPTSAALTSWIGYLSSNAGPQYHAEMSVDNELTSWEATDLTSDTGATVTVPDSIFGVRAGDFMPAGVAMVASLEISRRYRGGHPRKYLPWGTAGTMASGSTIDWDSGFVSDCQTKFSDFLSQLIGTTYDGCTFAENVSVSYVSGGARRATAVVDPITSSVIRSRICSQRRRLGKIGG